MIVFSSTRTYDAGQASITPTPNPIRPPEATRPTEESR